MARIYDEQPVDSLSIKPLGSKNYLVEVLLAEISKSGSQEAPVLDLACGTGDNMRDLLAAGVVPVGVDVSESMLGVARSKLNLP
jgi:ubiquinone/menaquinone biosynthesis C-methylase UbiE